MLVRLRIRGRIRDSNSSSSSSSRFEFGSRAIARIEGVLEFDSKTGLMMTMNDNLIQAIIISCVNLEKLLEKLLIRGLLLHNSEKLDNVETHGANNYDKCSEEDCELCGSI